MAIPINTIVLVLLLAGLVFLQVFLSRRAGTLPGLVIPFVLFAFSAVGALNATTPAAALVALLVWNIPTVIFLAIYFGIRSDRKRKEEMEKMLRQDLE